MIIEINASYPRELHVAFEELERRMLDKHGVPAHQRFDHELGLRIPYPTCFFDIRLQRYRLRDTKTNRRFIEKLREKYFQDENQVKLI